jgi:hypothetical protein
MLTTVKTIKQGYQTGNVKMTVVDDVQEGWLISNGETIGNTGSGAAHTGAEYYSLYEKCKANGYGNLGSEDWASGNTVKIPDFRGLLPIGAGTTNRAAGVDAEGNFYTSTLGTYYTDIQQAHFHAKGDIAISSGGGHLHSIDPGSTVSGTNSATHTHAYNTGNGVFSVASDLKEESRNCFNISGTSNTGDASATHTHALDISAFDSATINHIHANVDFTGAFGSATLLATHGDIRSGAKTQPPSVGIVFAIKI